MRLLLDTPDVVPIPLVRNQNQYDAWAFHGIYGYIGDLKEPDSLSGLSKMDIDVVIHTASITGDWVNEKLAYQVNATGTQILVNNCQHVKRFVHVSTIGVYGHKTYSNIDENKRYRKSTSPYENAKIEAEKIIKRATIENPTCRYIIIRLSSMYGEGDRNLFPRLVKFVQKRNFTFIGYGKILFPVIHAEDAARAVIQAMDYNIPTGSIFHISGPETTLRHFMEILTKVMNADPAFKTLPYYPALVLSCFYELKGRIMHKEPWMFRKRIRYLGRSRSINTSRIERELHFRANIKPEDGIIRTFLMFKEEERQIANVLSVSINKSERSPIPFFLKKVLVKNAF